MKTRRCERRAGLRRAPSYPEGILEPGHGDRRLSRPTAEAELLRVNEIERKLPTRERNLRCSVYAKRTRPNDFPRLFCKIICHFVSRVFCTTLWRE